MMSREQLSDTRIPPGQVVAAPVLQAAHRTPSRILAIILSMVALGVALSRRDGTYIASSIPLLAASVVFAVIALFATKTFPTHRFASVLRIGVAIQFGLAFAGALQHNFAGHDVLNLWPFHLASLLLLVAAMLACSANQKLSESAFLVLLTALMLAGAILIFSKPHPRIDVWLFQQEAPKALLRGLNPYRMTFENIYGQDAPWYGPGVSVNGVLQFGYPYMPVTLFMTLPNVLINGDYRYADLLCIIISGAIIACFNRSRWSIPAAVLFLTSTRGYYVLVGGWTEPLEVLLLALLLLAAARKSRWTPYLFGVFLASKQYLPFAVVFTPLLVGNFNPKQNAIFFAKAALAGCAVSLPLILWDLHAFMNSAVTLQMRQPFRWDSLSFLAWWIDGEKSAPYHPSAAWAFAALCLAMATSIRFLPRTAGGFALALAVTYLCFFAFNKQAFCNYYFLVIAAACASIPLLTENETRHTPKSASYVD